MSANTEALIALVLGPLLVIAIIFAIAVHVNDRDGGWHSHPTAVGGERIRYSHRHLPGAEHLHHDGYEFRCMTHRDRRLPRGWDGISPKPPVSLGDLVRAQRSR